MFKCVLTLSFFNYTEEFDVVLDDSNNLSYSLRNYYFSFDVGKKIKNSDNIDNIHFDFSISLENYKNLFGFLPGDLVIFQFRNYIVLYIKDKDFFVKVSFSEILQNELTALLLPKLISRSNEDKQILINSALNDFIINDYSNSQLNKEVKYIKLALILNYLKRFIPDDILRIVIDDSLIGDVDVFDVIEVFQFLNFKKIKVATIDTLVRIAKVLEYHGVIQTKIDIPTKGIFIDNVYSGVSDTLVIEDKNGARVTYTVIPGKNYTFDLSNQTYTINFGNMRLHSVIGKIFVLGNKSI
ncbi:MAG: hypothetical protein N3A71_03920 [Candidatus Dojkabacteria bacterium]|nr:hypothetical protein [Candidatus Dojkabacteria bacterium]